MGDSMWRYGEHARNNAHEIGGHLAELLENEGSSFDALRKWFNSKDTAALLEIEQRLADDIADFIRRSESQRPAAIRRMMKERGFDTTAVLLLLAVLGADRAATLAEIRDQYASALNPGRGYRVVTAELYLCALEIPTRLSGYEWPDEIFFELGYAGAEED